MKLIKTWAQLYERLDRQSLANTKESCTLAKAKESRITLKNKDGSLSFLTLVYDVNGSSWWFEKIDELER